MHIHIEFKHAGVFKPKERRSNREEEKIAWKNLSIIQNFDIIVTIFYNFIFHRFNKFYTYTNRVYSSREETKCGDWVEAIRRI